MNSGEIEGGFQVNGASGAENQFNIDGVSTTSLINGKSRQDAVFEILQEVQVKTGGIDAEYGGALGGVISAVTKSGGNAFHGDLHYYYSGNALSAAPVLRLFADPVTEKTGQAHPGHEADRQPARDRRLARRLLHQEQAVLLHRVLAALPHARGHLQVQQRHGNRRRAPREHLPPALQQAVLGSGEPRPHATSAGCGRPPRQNGYLPDAAAPTLPDTTTLSLAATTPSKDSGYFQPQSSYTGQVDISRHPAPRCSPSAAAVSGTTSSTTGLPNTLSISYLHVGVEPATYRPIPADLQQPKGYANIARNTVNDYDIVTRTFIQTDFSKFGNFLGQHNLKGGWGFTKTVNRMDNHETGGGWIGVYWNSQRVSTDPTTRGHLRLLRVQRPPAPRAPPARACTTSSSRTSGGSPSA